MPLHGKVFIGIVIGVVIGSGLLRLTYYFFTKIYRARVDPEAIKEVREFNRLHGRGKKGVSSANELDTVNSPPTSPTYRGPGGPTSSIFDESELNSGGLGSLSDNPGGAAVVGSPEYFASFGVDDMSATLRRSQQKNFAATMRADDGKKISDFALMKNIKQKSLINSPSSLQAKQQSAFNKVVALDEENGLSSTSATASPKGAGRAGSGGGFHRGLSVKVQPA